MSLRWKSSNKKVATVDQKGTVKVDGTGKVTITATLPEYGMKAKSETFVVVKNKNKVPEGEMTLYPNSHEYGSWGEYCQATSEPDERGVVFQEYCLSKARKKTPTDECRSG